MSKQKAKKLAQRPYTIEIYGDQTTTGEPVFLASHPELPGCMAQGETMESAIDELGLVTIEYIESLIEDNLPIPEPLIYPTQTSSDVMEVLENEYSKDFLQDLGNVIQPSNIKLHIALKYE